jgi:hypothetical protein
VHPSSRRFTKTALLDLDRNIDRGFAVRVSVDMPRHGAP